MRPVYGRCPSTRNIEKTLRTPTPLRGWIPGAGLHITLGFQTIERSVDSADGNFAARPRLNLLPDSHAVGFPAKAQHCQQHDVLKFAQILAL